MKKPARPGNPDRGTKDAAGRTGAPCVAVAAWAILLCAPPAGADVDEYAAVKVRFLVQEQGMAAPAVDRYEFQAWINASAGDAGAVHLAVGDADAFPMVEVSPGEWCTMEAFATLGALNDAYQSATVLTYSVSGGSLGSLEDALSLTTSTEYPENIVFTPDTMERLSSVEPDENLQLEWAALPLSSTARRLFLRNLATDELVLDGTIPFAQTAFSIPAALLEPLTGYEISVLDGHGTVGQGVTDGFGTQADAVTGLGTITTASFITLGACPADIDQDGDADVDDIGAFVDAFLDAVSGNADIDADGDEDVDDIAAFVDAFIAGCG